MIVAVIARRSQLVRKRAVCHPRWCLVETIVALRKQTIPNPRKLECLGGYMRFFYRINVLIACGLSLLIFCYQNFSPASAADSESLLNQVYSSLVSNYSDARAAFFSTRAERLLPQFQTPNPPVFRSVVPAPGELPNFWGIMNKSVASVFLGSMDISLDPIKLDEKILNSL